MSSEVFEGTATGAAAGAQVGGVWGAVIGGAIGAIAGLFGKKGTKLKKKAAKEEKAMAEREAAVQRRDAIRSFRIARAQTVAAGSSEEGGLTSSAVQGQLSSVSSQAASSLLFFNRQINSQELINQYLKKSDKYSGYFNMFKGVASSVGSMGSMGGGKGDNSGSKSGSGSRTGLMDQTYGGGVKTYAYDDSYRMVAPGYEVR